MAHLRFHVLATVALSVVLVAGSPASAHDLQAVVRVEADRVEVEAGYDDDTPASEARVTVKNSGGDTIATGVLDVRGLWSFPRPLAGDYIVVVEQAGHRDRVKFAIPGAAAPSSPAPEVATYSSWRLDKRLGLVIGLIAILGGTLAYVYFRRGRSTPGP